MPLKQNLPLTWYAVHYGTIFFAISICGCLYSRPNSTLRSQITASDLSLRALDGQQFHLSDYLGKQVVILDFWTTWCQPCEAMLPQIDRLYRKYQSRGLVVLGISMDDSQTLSQVPGFVARYQLGFPVLLDEETKAVQLYNPRRTAPFQVIVDRSGRIVRERQGYNVGDEEILEAEISRLLAEKVSTQ